MILLCPNVGIVFTHGVQLHEQVCRWAGINSFSGLYLIKYFSKVKDVDTWISVRGCTRVMS